MKKVVLSGTGLQISRFGFGTSGLFRVGSARRRARLVSAAYESGISHFDTAPYYGFGIAERDLKPLLAAHDEITVATKVGIYPPGGTEQTAFSVLVRKAGGKMLPALSRPSIDWSVERARKSLDGSLRRLGRDRVDLFFLHEPEAHLLDTEEWMRWLESETDRVGYFGIAAESKRLPLFLQAQGHPLTRVIQTTDSVQNREADLLIAAGRKLQITYGYLSAAKAEPNFSAKDILAAALKRNAAGCVLVFTSREERLPIFAEIESQPSGQ